MALRAKTETFTCHGEDKSGVRDFLTELGPEKIIAVTETRYYCDHQRVTVWYWEGSIPDAKDKEIERLKEEILVEGPRDRLDKRVKNRKWDSWH